MRVPCVTSGHERRRGRVRGVRRPEAVCSPASSGRAPARLWRRMGAAAGSLVGRLRPGGGQLVEEIRYTVDDVDATLDFFTTRLGFELVERPGPPSCPYAAAI